MSSQIKRAGSKKNLRSRSIPVNNIYEINSLNDIPNKDLHYKVIKDIINNHIDYLKTLNASELSSQINTDIDNYNNHINLIKNHDNKLLQDEHKLYGRLLTILHADKIYLDKYVENDINTIDEDYFNPRVKNNSEIDYDNTELYEDENNFYDEAKTEYDNLVEEVQNYSKIQNINDLLKFAGDYKPEVTFYNNKDNYDTTTNNFKLESINQLIKIMKKVDKAIQKYNEFIEYFENGGKISTDQFNKVVDRIINVSKLFKYYHFTEISKEQLYPIDLVFNSSYSEEFNKMLFEDFNVKYQKFKKENKNIKHNTFMFFKYYYLDDPEKSHNTPIKDDNYYSPEKILSGESMKEIIEDSDKTKGSDAEITNLEEPVANSILSFEFFNFYDKSHNEISDILKNMDIDYNESAGFKELNKFNSNVSKKRFNREGELFTYKINTKAIEEYFRSKIESNFKSTFLSDRYTKNQIKIKNYTRILIEYLNRLQIFEEFNAKRVEYNYNCLLYALYTWMKDNLSEDVAQKICLDLMCFNFSRFVTLKDISVINKYFKNNAKDFGKRYKIKIYKWNNVMNRLINNGKNDADVDYYIPIALLESSNMNIDINHFIIYEDIDFMKIAKKIGLSETEFTKENNDEMLKLMNDLKTNSKNNNWKTLNGYLLIKYLLNSEVKIKNEKGKDKTIKFFTPLSNDEIDELIDEKDELNNKIKEKELYKMINEMSNYDLSILQERAFKRVKAIINSKFNKKNYKDINDFISGVIINDKKYEHLCFYDFEASTHEKDHHKAYMVCYAIINFPERILTEDDLKKFKEDFNKNYKIQTIYGEDCAERFLKAIPDKTLCYAHNAKYDTSFFDYSNIDIVESCEKDGNMYSRDIIYNNKYITFKDSYKLISSKLSKFPEMFALGDIQKEVFPYNFYTIDNLNKYKNINFKLGSKEFESIEDELRQGFNKINDDKKNEAYEKFREIIKTKFNGIFNMRRYSKFYCERDVEILFKGLICMRTYLYKITALDCLKYLTISTIAHRHMINDVYSKTSFSSDSKTNSDNKNNNGEEVVNNNTYLEDLYNTTGVLNQYIQSSIWGGVCASYKNAKLLIKKVISDFDAVSLYTSAMKRINIITGKCRKFELNELDEINKSMNVYDSNGNIVGYNNKNCWLLKNTNKEKEKDKNKINMYVVTIRIKDSKIKRANPRIIVKNEIICGKIKKYPNLPVGNIMVNVDKNADLNDYRYKYDHVNECIVTIDNIMLEDYIEFHDIEFEVLAGVYWRDCCTIPLIECFLKYSVLESKSQELIESKTSFSSVKYDDILDAKFLIKPELKEAYYNLVEKYQNIRNGVKNIVQSKTSFSSGGKRLDQLTNEEKNKIVESNKKIEKIKEEINDLDDILCNTRSSKHDKIQEVMQQLFNARLKYKSEGNPLEGVIKLLLNSVYGKTIQKPTTKKINYVRVLVNNEINLNEKPEHVRNYIIKEYNRFVENYRLKLDDMYSNDEITKDEYDSKVNSIEKLVTINDDGIFKCYYSPLITFVENNKNKIVGMNKVNYNMYRIETIEQIEQHKSFNHVGVQILSMSKRIVNEVICTAQDLGFKVYYQDTDSIHIDYANIPKLSEEFKRKYNRDLIGKGLGQFHSDFEPCKIKNGEKPDVTLALLTIINGKKNYIDVKFNPACYFENFDKDKDYNVCLDKKYHEELDILDIIKNYHIRNKGINKSGVVSTSEELGVSCPELYLKIFNNEKIKFNLSKARPSFQFTKTLTVVNKELNRFVQTEGNRIVIEEGKEDVVIAENEWNRKNVRVDVDMSVRDHPVINIVGKIDNDFKN